MSLSVVSGDTKKILQAGAYRIIPCSPHDYSSMLNSLGLVLVPITGTNLT